MFTVPMAGQLGFFSRITYNNRIISHGKISEKDINPSQGFKHFGKIKSEYIIVKGSISGPAKRQILLSYPSRPSKKQIKLKYSLLSIE